MNSPFANVYELYRQQTDPRLTSLSLPEFSRLGNYATQSNVFDPGVEAEGFGGLVKKGSYWLNKGLEYTGLPDVAGDLGAKVFGTFGADEQAGRALGESLPRGFVNYLPPIALGVAAPFTGSGSLAFMPYALGAAGALGAADTYEATGSKGQAAVSAALPFVGAAAGRMAGNAATSLVGKAAERMPFLKQLGLMGGEAVEGVGRTGQPVINQTLTSFADRLAHYTGSQVGAAGAMEAAQRAFGMSPYPFFSKETLLNATLGNLPFAAIDVPGLLKPQVISSVPKSGVPATPAPEIMPVAPVDPKVAEATQKQGELFKRRMMAVKAAEALSSEVERSAAIKAAHEEFNKGLAELAKGSVKPSKGKAFGHTEDFYADPQIKDAVAKFKEKLALNPPNFGEEGGPLLNIEGPPLEGQPIEFEPSVPPGDLFSEENIVNTQVKANKINVANEAPIVDDAKMEERITDFVEQKGDDVVEATQKAVTASKEVAKERARKKSSVETARKRKEGANARSKAIRITPQQQEGMRLYSELEQRVAQGDEFAREVRDVMQGFFTDPESFRPSHVAPEEWTKNSMGALYAQFRLWNEQVAKGEHGADRKEHIKVLKNMMVQKLRTAVTRKLDYLKSADGVRDEVFDTREAANKKAAELGEGWKSDNYHDKFRVGKKRTFQSLNADETGKLEAEVTTLHDVAQSNDIVTKSVSKEFVLDKLSEYSTGDLLEFMLNDELAMERLDPNNRFTAAQIQEHLAELITKKPKKARALMEKMLVESREFDQGEMLRGNVGELDAGGGLTYPLVDYDPTTNKLGKHTLPRNALLTQDAFMKMAGEFGPMSKDELALYKTLVPEAFGVTNVDVRKLFEGLAKKDPVVETHVYGQGGKVSEAKAELDKMTHEWLETLPSNKRLVANFHTAKAIFERWLENNSKLLPSTPVDNNAASADADAAAEAAYAAYAASDADADARAAYDAAYDAVSAADHEHARKRASYNDAVTRARTAWEKIKKSQIYNDPLATSDEFVAYAKLKELVASEPPDTSPRATTAYNQISPFDTKKFPVVRVDAVLPEGPRKSYEEALKEWNLPDTPGNRSHYERSLKAGTETNKPLWTQDNLHENLPNTLGWAMVQFVPDPRTGEMVAFVGEQQSRWGQARQKYDTALAKTLKSIEEVNDPRYDVSERNGKYFSYTEYSPDINVGNPVIRFAKDRAEIERYLTKNRRGNEIDSHPLLPLQHTLVLKAVIAEAAKRGVKRVVLSDAETAMMTEGHDKATTATIGNQKVEIGNTGKFRPVKVGDWVAVSRDESTKVVGETEAYLRKFVSGKDAKDYEVFRPITEADLRPAEPPQSGGMRLHYDTTLPSAMKKLTGTKGERVEMGVHKNATKTTLNPPPDPNRRPLDDFHKTVVGSPVFRNPDGTPKSSITGIAYSLENLSPKATRLFGKRGERLSDTLQREATWLPSFDEAFHSALLHQGVTREQAKVAAPFIKTLNEVLGLKDVRFGQVLERRLASGQMLRGAANITSPRDAPLRKIYIAASEASKGKPVTDQVGELATLFAHEAGHAVDHLKNLGLLDKESTRILDEGEAWFDAALPEDRTLTLKTLADGLLPEHIRKLKDVDELLNATDGKEAMATAYAMWAMGKAHKESSPMWAMLPRPVRQMFKTIASWAQRLAQAFKTSVSLGGQKAPREMAGKLTKQFEAMRKQIREAEQRIAEMQDFFGLDAEGAEQRRVGMDASLADESPSAMVRDTVRLMTRGPGSETLGSQALRTGSLLLEGLDHLGQRYPNVKRLAQTVLDMGPNMHLLNQRIMAPLDGDIDPATGGHVTDPKKAQWLNTVSTQVAPNELIGKVGFWANRQAKDNQGVIPVVDPDNLPTAEMQRDMEALTEDQRQAVKFYLAGQHQSNLRAQQAIVLNNRMRYREGLAKIVASGRPELFERAHDIADSAFLADEKLGVGDTAGFQQAFDEVTAAVGDPKVAEELVLKAQTMNKSLMELQAFFDKRPGNMSEMRVGKYFGRVYDASGTELEAEQQVFSSPKEVRQFEKEQAAKGLKTQIEEVSRGFKVKFSGELRDVLEKTENRLHTLITEALAPRTRAEANRLNDALGQFSLLNEVERYTATPSVMKPGTRRLAESAANIDYVEAHRAYARVVANALTNSTARAKFGFEMLNPKLANLPQQVKQVQQGFTNYTTPDSPVGSAISKGMFNYFMGLNLPNHLVELFQPVMTVLPEMVGRSDNATKSFGTLMGAAKDVGVYLAKKKTGKFTGKEEWQQWPDKDEARMLAHMADKGYLSRHAFLEGSEHIGSSTTSLRRRTESKGRFADVLAQGFRPFKAFADFSTRLYENFTRFNSRVASIAGYRMAKEMGMDFTGAVKYAEEFASLTTQAAGKAGRPTAPFAMDDHTLGQVAMSLQGYTRSWIAQFARYLQHASMTGDQLLEVGGTPGQRKASAKALATMLGAQLAGAGALGLPFAGAMATIFEKITGYDVRGELYKKIGELMDDDEQDGNIIGDTVLHGLANVMFDKAGLPIDLAGRFGIGGTPGFNERDGFNAGNVFGPVVGLMNNAIGGVKALAQGDVVGAGRSALPPFAKKALDLWANGDATTNQGSKLGLRNDTERVLYALGFSNSRVKKLQEFERYQQSNEQRRIGKEGEVADEIIDALNEGDIGKAQQRLQEAAIATHGTKSLREWTDAVAERVIKQTFAKDFRGGIAEADAPDAQAMMRGMGLQMSPSNEMERFTLRQHIAEMLGVPMAMPGRSMFNARYRDEQTMEQPQWPFQQPSLF